MFYIREERGGEEWGEGREERGGKEGVREKEACHV